MTVQAAAIAAIEHRQAQADLERQQNRSDLLSHEKICGERYASLDASNADIKTQLEGITKELKAISEAQATAAGARQALAGSQPKWWQQLLGAAVVGLIGWMAATIWNMEAAKVDAALQRPPAATVTVNPQPVI